MSDEAHDSPSYPPPPDDLVLLAPAEAPRDDGGHAEPHAHAGKRSRGEYAPGDLGEGDAKRRREGRRGFARTGQACDRCKVPSLHSTQPWVSHKLTPPSRER